MTDYLIVGGGFVGTVAAAELLGQAPAGTRITLINGGGALGRGLAYGTNSAEHLLNVPAARMSWHPQQPDDFVDWLAQQGLDLGPGDFAPRMHYGRYLADRLEQAIAARPDLHWQQSQGRVQSLKPNPQGGWTAALESGQPIQARGILLALGNFSPSCPHVDLSALPAGCYVDDTWGAQALQGLATDAPVAIIGTGLTMLDLLASLQVAGHRGPILALSRRGLLPQSHRRNELPPPDWHPPAGWLTERPLHLLSAARQVRQAVEAAVKNGNDWRDIWVALRARTAELWQSLTPREHAQFLRHLQALWDVHRHRAAPQALEPLQRAMSEGRLQLMAGRLVAATSKGSGVSLQWRSRLDGQVRSFDAARVFNCTGPSNRIDDDRSPLFASLLRNGQLRSSRLGLGVEVNGSYHLLNAQGQAQPGLYYAGPMLKSQHWEATAVPELRIHARQAAASMLAAAD